MREISESSRLRVESLRICDSLVRLLSLREGDADGWLSLLSLPANNLALFLKVRCELFSLMVELSACEARESRQSMDCTLNSCTARSSALRLLVSVNSWRGRQYLRMVLPQLTTTPQRRALKEVRTQFLARQMASSMNCLCICLTVSGVWSVNASSSEQGTYWQIRSRECSFLVKLRRLMVFRCEMVFNLSTFSISSSNYASSLKEYRLCTNLFPPSSPSCPSTPKGKLLPLIQYDFCEAIG